MAHEYESLIGARTELGTEIKVYDDRGDRLYAACHEHGVFMVIRTQRSYENAWGIMVDEMSPVALDDLHEAFGFYILDNPQGGVWLCANEAGVDTTTVFVGKYRCTHDVVGAYADSEGARELALELASDKCMSPVEGYEYQSNATGTGIVDVGHYVSVYEVSEDYLKDTYGITLEWRTDDD